MQKHLLLSLLMAVASCVVVAQTDPQVAPAAPTSSGAVTPQVMRTPYEHPSFAPAEAFSACASKQNGAACEFQGHAGRTVHGVCDAPRELGNTAATVCHPRGSRAPGAPGAQDAQGAAPAGAERPPKPIK